MLTAFLPEWISTLYFVHVGRKTLRIGGYTDEQRMEPPLDVRHQGEERGKGKEGRSTRRTSGLLPFTEARGMRD